MSCSAHVGYLTEGRETAHAVLRIVIYGQTALPLGAGAAFQRSDRQRRILLRFFGINRSAKEYEAPEKSHREALPEPSGFASAT